MSYGKGWNEEMVAAHNAKRARECAIADGRVETSMDRSVATIERVVAAELARVPESSVLATVLEALRLHPKVAWAERMNVGGARYGERYVHFGWQGMADITGQMRDGRRLEVECKASFGKLAPSQLAYLQHVKACNGVAFCARGVSDVIRELAVA